jgi:hypothetical protein
VFARSEDRGVLRGDCCFWEVLRGVLRVSPAWSELPIIVYTATSNPPAVSTDCPICLAEFADGEKLRLMPNCSHSFHVECIDQWLFSHSSCPLCRHSLNLKKKPGGAVIVQAAESDNATHTEPRSGIQSRHTEPRSG